MQAVPPTLTRSLWEGGIGVAGIIAGLLAPWPILKLFFWGFGGGALLHLGGALLDGYVIRPMFVSSGAGTSSAVLSNVGQRLYTHEQNAANAAVAAQTASTTGGTVTSLGAPPGGQPQRGTAAGTAVRPKVQTLGAPPIMLAAKGTAAHAVATQRDASMLAVPPAGFIPTNLGGIPTNPQAGMALGGAPPTGTQANPPGITPTPVDGGGGGNLGNQGPGGGGGGGIGSPCPTPQVPNNPNYPTGAPAPCGDPPDDEVHPMSRARLREFTSRGMRTAASPYQRRAA